VDLFGRPLLLLLLLLLILPWLLRLQMLQHLQPIQLRRGMLFLLQQLWRKS
jgi:hypothetical protein